MMGTSGHAPWECRNCDMTCAPGCPLYWRMRQSASDNTVICWTELPAAFPVLPAAQRPKQYWKPERDRRFPSRRK